MRSFLLSLFSKDLAILLTASLLVCSCPSAAVTFAATNEAAAGITHLTESGSTSGAENVSLGTGSNAASPANGSNNQTKSASEGTASDADEIINNLARTSGKHSITVLLGSASAESAARGDVVTLNAVLSVGELNFSSWTSTNPDVVFKDPTAANTTFVMPDSEVEITAEYGEAAVLPAMSALSLLPSQKNTPTYRLELINTTAVVNGGPVQTGNITVYPADNITLTDIPSDLTKKFSNWSVSSTSGDSLPVITGNTFTMPNSDLSVAPEYKTVSLNNVTIGKILSMLTIQNYNPSVHINTVNSIFSATANMTPDQLNNLSEETQSLLDHAVIQSGNFTLSVQAENDANAASGNSLIHTSVSGLSTAAGLSSLEGIASVNTTSGRTENISGIQGIQANFVNQVPVSLDSSAGNVSISNFNGNHTALVSSVQPGNNTFFTDSYDRLYVVNNENVAQGSLAVISSADLQKLKSQIYSGNFTVGNFTVGNFTVGSFFSYNGTDINNTANTISSDNISGHSSAAGNIPAYSGASGNSITSGNYTASLVYNAGSSVNIGLDLRVVSSAGITDAEARNRLYANLTFANPIQADSIILHNGNGRSEFYSCVSSTARSVPYNGSWSSVAIFEPAVIASSPPPSPVKIAESSTSGSSGDSGRSVSEGSWIQDNTGWWYRRQNGTYPSGEWAYLWYNGRYDWYYFNADGYMATGFLTWNGNRYYLNPVSDGTQGRMLTGKQLIDGKSCYFREEKDGPLGSLAEEAKLET